MSRALRIILGIEVVIGLLWTVLAAMAQGAGGLAVFGIFLIVYALYATFFLIAVWAYWKYPDQRKTAGWIMALPFIFWFLPLMIRSMAGGVLTNDQFIVALLVLMAAGIGVCWFAPRKAVAVIPDVVTDSLAELAARADRAAADGRLDLGVGDLEEEAVVLPIREKELEVRLRVFGDRQPHTILCMNNLACILLDQF